MHLCLTIPRNKHQFLLTMSCTYCTHVSGGCSFTLVMNGWFSNSDAVGLSDAFLVKHDATKSLNAVEKFPSRTGDGF